MCGKLKYEDKEVSIGHPIIVRDDESTCIVPWLGHARFESLKEKGLNPSQTKVRVPVSGYTEKGVWFDVPGDSDILGIRTKNERLPDGEGVFIVTRPANSAELQKCAHPRHPLFVRK